MSSALASLACNAIARGVRLPDRQRINDFVQQGKLIDLLKRLDINLFLDVGANRGFFSEHLRLAGYKGMLLSFEPVPTDYEEVCRRAEGDDLWHPINCAAGAETGTASFSVYSIGNETALSSFLNLREHDADRRTIEVPVKRLDQAVAPFIEKLGDARIFLKTDTQGFDLQVVAGAGGILDQVRGLQSEISVQPLYDGMPHFTESLAHYESLGFALMDMFVVRRTGIGAVLEYDCVMARPERLPGN